jgi:hypothetical protein
MRPTPAPHPSQKQQTYRWWLLPRADRFPKRWAHWLPLTLTVVLVAGITTVGAWAGPWLSARISCRGELLPTSNVWSQDGECVGLSDGPYAFGLSAFDPVFQKIASQNKDTEQNPCATGAAPVTVGVLVTATSLAAGGRARHELEGFAAGQANTNTPVRPPDPAAGRPDRQNRAGRRRGRATSCGQPQRRRCGRDGPKRPTCG